MSKKSSPAHKPPTAQLDAIRRLIYQDGQSDWDTLRARVTALRKQFPDYRPLMELAWEIEDSVGDHWAAALIAYDWVEVAPMSFSALSALSTSGLSAGLLVLAMDASIRGHRINGRDMTDLPTIPTEFGEMTGKEARTNDIARLLLHAHRFDAITRLLANEPLSALRNNYAIALFAQGNISQAREVLEAAWQAQPRNLFSLERLIRLRYWTEGRASVAGLEAPLRTTPAVRSEDAYAKVAALCLLDQWQDADGGWKESVDAEFWKGDSEDLRARTHYLGALVALRLGNQQEAKARLQRIPIQHFSNFWLSELDNALRNNSDDYLPEIGELSAWFPFKWIQQFQAINKSAANLDESVKALFHQCAAHNDYLALAVELGGQQSSKIALEVLKWRAEDGNAQALAQLRTLLTRPCGPDSVRISLLNRLNDAKLVEKGSAWPVLIGGKLTQLQAKSFRITPEPTEDNPYPPSVQKHYERMTDFLHAGNAEAAFKLAQDIYRQQPDVPMSAANLAIVKEALNHPDQEIEILFQQALTLNPDYIFARAGLTRQLAKRGELSAARDMLQHALEREEYHLSEWRTILLAQREMARAENNPDALKAIAQSLQQLEGIRF